MANVVVVGAQWGDEGKGKIVDWLSERADVIARFQGGHNAGHTLVINGKVFKLSLLPSGIVRPGKLSVIGNGVVLDPWALIAEIDKLRGQGVEITRKLLAGWPVSELRFGDVMAYNEVRNIEAVATGRIVPRAIRQRLVLAAQSGLSIAGAVGDSRCLMVRSTEQWMELAKSLSFEIHRSLRNRTTELYERHPNVLQFNSGKLRAPKI